MKWRFACAQATGTSHLKIGVSCQDRFACEVTDAGTITAIISDGAGSAAMAGRGAEIAVTTVASRVKQARDENRTDYVAFLREAAQSAREAIASEAFGEGRETRDYACTLLAVVLAPDGGAAMQLGDGLIVVADGGDEWAWVFWPQRGEYANTTHFLSDEGAMDRLEVDALPRDVTDIALMSDGVEVLALHYASETVHQPFFRGVFEPLIGSEGLGNIVTLSAALEEFLSSGRVSSRTDDDLSLILATRRNPD